MPTLFVVAGVNGSGKSTLTKSNFFKVSEIIDPDAIAKVLSKRADQSARVTAGRAALLRRRALFDARSSFVVETTLSGQGPLTMMRDAQDIGYKVELHYVYLMDVAQSADRVKTRVAKGGHDIPIEDIQRRFGRSRDNLLPGLLIADRTVIYDNSGLEAPFQRVCQVQGDVIEMTDLMPDWLCALLDADAV